MTSQLKSCLSCSISKVLVLTESVDIGSFPACFVEEDFGMSGGCNYVQDIFYIFNSVRFLILRQMDDKFSGAFGTFQNNPTALVVWSGITDRYGDHFISDRLIAEPTLFARWTLYIIAVQI